MRLILASASPRRREMLQALGLKFEVTPADIDETPNNNEAPLAYVRRLAVSKARHVFLTSSDVDNEALVLAADTTVVINDRILGKPEDPQQGLQMLQQLSGKIHSVLTSVAIHGIQQRSIVTESRVHFRNLSADEMNWYVSTQEGSDKAGGYALQGLAANFIQSIEGSHTGIIGLPMAETIELLTLAGVPLPWTIKP